MWNVSLLISDKVFLLGAVLDTLKNVLVDSDYQERHNRDRNDFLDSSRSQQHCEAFSYYKCKPPGVEKKIHYQADECRRNQCS